MSSEAGTKRIKKLGKTEDDNTCPFCGVTQVVEWSNGLVRCPKCTYIFDLEKVRDYHFKHIMDLLSKRG